MATITDEEFGTITIRRNRRASQVRIRVAPNGRLHASLPLYAPLFLLKRLIKNSRPQLREMMSNNQPDSSYHDGMVVGKSHSIVVRPSSQSSVKAKRHGQQIIVSLPTDMALDEPTVTRTIRDTVIDALRIESKSYLPKRLAFLAEKHDVSYDKVRFSHASGRWGSCSSNGTISLNIALMKLPFELIDYVLIHELAHTVHMNHSSEFWELVQSGDPRYKVHKAELQKQTPAI